MIMVFGVAVMLASVPLCGGRLGALATVRPRSAWMISASLAAQVVVITLLPASMPEPVAQGVHLASYVFAAAFVWRNRTIPGLWLIAVGGGCNLIAIAANNGVMPASPAALTAAGRVPPSGQFVNSGPMAHPRLPWLGDVFAIPKQLPLNNVFSIGDVLLVIGMGLLLHRVCGTKIARASRRSRAKTVTSVSAATPAPNPARNDSSTGQLLPVPVPWPAPWPAPGTERASSNAPTMPSWIRELTSSDA
jgi:hypothetical protein